MLYTFNPCFCRGSRFRSSSVESEGLDPNCEGNEAKLGRNSTEFKSSSDEILSRVSE